MGYDYFYDSGSENFHDYVLHAAKEGYYVEAFTLIHMMIESELKEFIIEGSKYNKNNPPKIKQVELGNLSYIGAARVGLFMDLYEESFFKRLITFNNVRNKLAHQTFKKEIEENYLKKELDKAIVLEGELAERLLKLQLNSSDNN